MHTDPYETLGVAPSAPAAGIRRAYFRLVRQHTPEDDPERFQAISAAYEVLGNAERRREFDERRGLSDGFRECLDEAAALLRRNRRNGLRELRRLAAESTSNAVVLRTIASIAVEGGVRRDTIPLLHDLHEALPEERGFVRLLVAALARASQYADALKVLNAAIEAAPKDLELRVILVRTWDVIGKPEKADDALDEAFASVERESPVSLPLHFEQLSRRLRDGEWKTAQSSVAQIQRCVNTGGQDARNDAVSRFLDLASESQAELRHRAAHLALTCAHQLDPDENLVAAANEAKRHAQAQKQARSALKSRLSPGWLCLLVRIQFEGGLGHTRVQDLFAEATLELSQLQVRARPQWKRFEEAHPLAAEVLAPLYRQATEVATAAARARSQMTVRALLMWGGSMGAILLIVWVLSAWGHSVDREAEEREERINERARTIWVLELQRIASERPANYDELSQFERIDILKAQDAKYGTASQILARIREELREAEADEDPE